MSRQPVAPDKRRVKFFLANCMVETWVQTAIAEIARTNGKTIREMAEQALTEFAERYTYTEPKADVEPAARARRRKK